VPPPEDTPLPTRGERIKAIREARDEDQERFAAAFNALAHQMGLRGVKYDTTKLSRTETNGRPLKLDEAVVIAELDPRRRGLEWLAVGEWAHAMRGKEPSAPRTKRRA